MTHALAVVLSGPLKILFALALRRGRGGRAGVAVARDSDAGLGPEDRDPAARHGDGVRHVLRAADARAVDLGAGGLRAGRARSRDPPQSRPRRWSAAGIRCSCAGRTDSC